MSTPGDASTDGSSSIAEDGFVHHPPRSPLQRKHDVLARLESGKDLWTASADDKGNPHLIPLSYIWDGEKLTMATLESSRTARNLRRSGRVRLATGDTRDVLIIDGTIEVFPLETVPTDLADTFAAKLWDARRSPQRYEYFQVTPQRIQAWHGWEEFSSPDLMRDGHWLVS